MSALAFALLLAGRLAIVTSSAAAEGQTTLRYAERDADRMAEVLRELGGFRSVWTLHQPTAHALEETLDRAERMAIADPTLELVVFYSGHADREGVLLRGERLSYRGLRARLERSRAAVRVLLLDACHSGGAVRAKGGQPSAGFAVEAELPSAVAGAAILTASTDGELAQESSEIEGSYFTHHLLSGLRGAADSDGNGQITLGEVYQYAASRTVAATLPSAFGPQHPAYDYHLSGTGDLVLTSVGRGTSALSFPGGAEERYYVTTRRQEMVAELTSHPGRRTRLALPAGRYRVVRRLERRAFVADVVLASGVDTPVEGISFRETAPELALAKGKDLHRRNELSVDVALSGLGPGLLGSTGELGLGWMRRSQRWSFGPHLSYGRAAGTVSAVDYRISRWTLTAMLLRRIPMPFVDLRFGAGVGVAAFAQTLDGAHHGGLAPVALGGLALDVPVLEWLSVRTMWGLGIEVLKLSGRYQVKPEARAALGTLVLF